MLTYISVPGWDTFVVQIRVMVSSPLVMHLENTFFGRGPIDLITLVHTRSHFPYLLPKFIFASFYHGSCICCSRLAYTYIVFPCSLLNYVFVLLVLFTSVSTLVPCFDVSALTGSGIYIRFIGRPVWASRVHIEWKHIFNTSMPVDAGRLSLKTQSKFKHDAENIYNDAKHDAPTNDAWPCEAWFMYT